MSRTDSNREIEVKLRVPDEESARALILAAGYHESVPRTLEVNAVFDTPESTIRQRGILLRLRKAGSKVTMTVKGPASPGKYKSRPEYEVTVSDFDTAQTMLIQLGFRIVFLYEKFRSEFASTNQSGTITLDDTPIGVFLELEGSAEWIDTTASALGFLESDYVLESYGTLYLDFCTRGGVTPGHMIF